MLLIIGIFFGGCRVRWGSKEPPGTVEEMHSSSASDSAKEACLLLDQIKREKGVWWMPWQ